MLSFIWLFGIFCLACSALGVVVGIVYGCYLNYKIWFGK